MATRTTEHEEGIVIALESLIEVFEGEKDREMTGEDVVEILRLVLEDEL